jgi:hypothetical protein
MRKIAAHETALRLRAEPVIHVKTGKSLTEPGAKLLGVEWPTARPVETPKV